MLPFLLLLIAPPLRADEQPRRSITIAAAHGPVLVEMPGEKTTMSRPAVIVLSGSKGFGSRAYDEMGRKFTAAGLDVFLVHFLSLGDLQALESAGNAASRKRYSAAQMPRWIASIRAVMAHLRTARVGLLGISLGATVAAASAQSDRSPAALVLVDGGTIPASIRIPPLLLVWGNEDRVFPPATAHAIKHAAEARGGTAQLDLHAGAAHDFFIRPGLEQAASAQAAAAQFLASQLAR